jgi:hypothetical protein
MLDYPFSILGYFLVGMFGAITFLFILLLFDKDVAILDNDFIPRLPMGVLYVVFGGLFAIIMNMANSLDFTANQLPIAFATGFGWPAIVAGIGAGKRVGELNQEKQKSIKMTRDLEDTIGRAREEVTKYYRNRLEQANKMFELAVQRAENEKEEILQYYANKISS